MDAPKNHVFIVDFQTKHQSMVSKSDMLQAFKSAVLMCNILSSQCPSSLIQMELVDPCGRYE